MIVTGSTVAHYRILEKLGAGGMGVVYRARDLKLDRDVVLKFLSPALTVDEDATRRLIQEAKAASALDHPNICTIYGLEPSDEGQAFISMAYYQGEILKDRIASGPLPVEEALSIARQIARGLAAAHAREIIHRDIKPANVIVTGDGVVKILDFGLAKLAGATRITQTGDAIGTAAYMSPERLRGEAVDGRTDIWSWGVVVYEMLTGALPFAGDRPHTLMHSILTAEPRPIAGARAGIPAPLQRIIARALVKDPAGRYAAMNEVLRDLQSFEGASDSDLPAIGPAGLPGPGAQSRRRRAVVAAAVVALLAGGALLWRTVRPSRPRPAVSAASVATSGLSTAAPRRVAVLPFANARQDPRTDYLAHALADRVTDRLGYVDGIVVRPSTATSEYQSASLDPAEAGRKLRVDYLVTGSFSSDPPKMRLDFDLVDVRSNRRIPLEPVEVGSDEAFRLQAIVAERVIRALGIDPLSARRSRVQADVPRNPLAYQYYLRSLAYPHGYGGNELAFPLLEKSIALDPGYAPAYAELGSRHELAAVYGLGGTLQTKEAEEAYSKALSLNRELLDALSGLARVYTDVGQSDKAIGLLRDALRINPNHADSHFALSYIYRYAGMLEESAREGELALSLDPNNPKYRSVATTYLYLGNLERSLEVHKLDPDSGWTLARIGQIYIRRQQNPRALEYLERAIAKEPDSSSGRWSRAMRAALQGRREEGLAVLQKSKEATMVDGEQRYHFANIHCLLGDRGGCLRGLQAAVNGGFFNYPFLLRDSFLDPVRNDRTFQRILADAKARHESFQARFFPNRAEPKAVAGKG